MPDDNKTTDTNPTPTQDVSGVGQTIPPMEPSISTPIPPPVSPTDQGQTTDTPPPAANSAVPPPPPIIEEQKEGEADIPPVITTGEKPKGKVGKKVIATILGILFLVGGVSAGVILVQRQQDIREKAAVEINGGGNGTPTEKCDKEGQCVGGGVAYRWITVTTYSGGNPCGQEHDPSCQDGEPAATSKCDKEGQCSGEYEYYTDLHTGRCALRHNTSKCGTVRGDETPNCPWGLTCGEYFDPDAGKCPSDFSYKCFESSTHIAICCKPPGTQSLEQEPEESGGNGSCSKNTDCGDPPGFRYRCLSGKCEPVRFCDANGCDVGSLYDTCYVNHYTTDDADDSTITDNRVKTAVQSSTLGLQDCGAEQIDVSCDGASYTDGVWKRYPYDCSGEEPSGISARCLNVRAFDTEWNELTSADLSGLKAGDTIRFTVSGTTSSGNIDKARFRINSPTWRTAVVAKKPGTNDFYDEYTIPEGVTSFTINVQLHHTSSDISWF